MRTTRTIIIKRRARSIFPHQSSLSQTQSVSQTPQHSNLNSQRNVKSESPRNVKSVKPIFISTSKNKKFVDLRKSLMSSKRKKVNEALTDLSEKELHLFSAHLREYLQSCAAKRKFKKCELTNQLILCVKLNEQNRKQKITDDNKETQFKRAKQRQDEQAEDHNYRISEFDEKAEKSREKLKRQHEKENENFQYVWSEKYPEKYRKSSTKLLQLKYIERSLIITGDYTKAEEVNQQINALQSQETKQQQNQMDNDYLQAKTQLEQKHKNEELLLENSIKERKEILINELKREKELLEMHWQMLQQKDTKNTRKMSSNSNNNVSYAKSFQHIAKDTNFGIDPLLPKLKPPAESTKEKKKKRNKAISPRSKTVIPNKAPRVFTSDEYASVFETSVQKFRVNDPIESENIKVEEKEEEPKIQINVENKNEESNSEQIKENISSSDSSSDSSTES